MVMILRKPNPALLGVFIIGAAIILVVAFLIFGPRAFTQYTQTYVLYFTGSLKGLHVGSPVTYRGIKIGEVTGVKMVYDPKKKSFRLPVYVRFMKLRTLKDWFEKPETAMRSKLRAKLEPTNLVTGELEIALVTEEKEPPRYVHDGSEYPEIPTLKSTTQMQELQEALEVAKATLNSIKDLVESEKVDKAIRNFDATMKSADTLLTNVNDNLEPIAVNFKEMLEELKETIRTLRSLVDYLSRHPESLLKGKS